MKEMDEKTRRRIELEGAEALLDIGVSVPLKSFRLPFRKKPVQWRVTMRRPTLGTHAAFAREYLKLGVTPEKMKTFTKEEEMEFLARHGKTLSRMVAVTLLRGPLRRRLLLGLTAWWVRERMERRYLLAAARQFARLSGTRSFSTIIASAERTNPMRPRTSQGKRGS